MKNLRQLQERSEVFINIFNFVKQWVICKYLQRCTSLWSFTSIIQLAELVESCKGMDTGEQLPLSTVSHNETSILTEEENRVHGSNILSSDEPNKSNGTSSRHIGTRQRRDSERRPSALAVFNRRIRLLFRPWKWRRKARSKQRSTSDSPKGIDDYMLKQYFLFPVLSLLKSTDLDLNVEHPQKTSCAPDILPLSQDKRSI